MKKSKRIIEDQSLTDSEEFEDFNYEEFSGMFSGGELDGLFSDSDAELDSLVAATENSL